MTDEEQKTWFEEYLYSTYGANAQYYVRIGAKIICKKILEEINSHKWDYEDAWNRSFEVIEISDIHKIIKDLGVEV